MGNGDDRARCLDLAIRKTDTGETWTKRLPLDKPTVSLGRNPDRSDVVLEVPLLGPARVELYPRDDAWLVVRVLGGPSDFPSGRIAKSPFDEDVPVKINDRPHGGAVVFEDVFAADVPNENEPRLVHRGDRLSLGPFEITFAWEGRVGTPLAIAHTWLPERPRKSPGRFGACMPNTDGSLTHQMVVGRDRKSGQWRVYGAMAVSFDYPSVRVYRDPANTEILCFAHSYAFYWSPDDGHTIRTVDAEQRNILGYSKFGRRRLGPIAFDGDDMLVHVLERDADGPPQTARVVDGDLRMVESDVTVERFRLRSSDGEAPRLEHRLEGAEAAAVLASLGESQPRPSPAAVPLRVRDQRDLEYMEEHAWQPVPLLELVRAFRDRTGLLL